MEPTQSWHIAMPMLGGEETIPSHKATKGSSEDNSTASALRSPGISVKTCSTSFGLVQQNEAGLPCLGCRMAAPTFGRFMP
jgi:hypothetical protein